MSIAHVCRNCPRFHKSRSWCDRNGHHVGQWDDWCNERKTDYDNWLLGQ